MPHPGHIAKSESRSMAFLCLLTIASWYARLLRTYSNRSSFDVVQPQRETGSHQMLSVLFGWIVGRIGPNWVLVLGSVMKGAQCIHPSPVLKLTLIDTAELLSILPEGEIKLSRSKTAIQQFGGNGSIYDFGKVRMVLKREYLGGNMMGRKQTAYLYLDC